MDKISEMIEQRLQELIQRFNSDPRAIQMIGKWIGDYAGKVIQFRVRDLGKSYLVCFTSKRVWMEECEYPSPDLILEADSDFISKILSKQRPSFSRALRDGILMIYGNLHEAFPLAELIKLVES